MSSSREVTLSIDRAHDTGHEHLLPPGAAVPLSQSILLAGAYRLVRWAPHPQGIRQINSASAARCSLATSDSWSQNPGILNGRATRRVEESIGDWLDERGDHLVDW